MFNGMVDCRARYWVILIADQILLKIYIVNRKLQEERAAFRAQPVLVRQLLSLE
jgi:hypothetical protein